MANPGKSELHELEILKEVEENSALTNRAVASKLGVSVKLAHDILKRMVGKGLLHVQKENSRSWHYFLTPQGISEKYRLTVDFLDFSMYFYREARKKSAQVCKDLTLAEINTVDCLGATELTEIVFLGLQEWKLKLNTIYDSQFEENEFLSVPVEPFENIKQSTADAVIVCLYDKSSPMETAFLPDGVEKKDNMVWVFG